MTTQTSKVSPFARQLAEQVRTACLQTLVEAYDQAASDGLCAEGAWEVALEQVQALDLEKLLREHLSKPLEEA